MGIIGAVCLAALAASVSFVGAQPDRVDAAFARFWAARNPDEAAGAATAVAATGVRFDEAVRRLERGRTYSAAVRRGVIRLSRVAGGAVSDYDVDVPLDYDPARRYQVRIQLHGSVGANPDNAARGDGSIGALAGAEQIYIQPYAGRRMPWWSQAQIENVRAILDSVKRVYNVDENRVVLAGISDGATGTWYFAARDPTPYAAFVSLNGFFAVLGNPATGTEGELFPNDWLNKPFAVVNGEADPLYPAEQVGPYMERLQSAGMSLEYWPQPGAGHTTSWWPEMKDRVESFVREHPRHPLPATLTWESTADPLSNRNDWLVIDRLSVDDHRAPLPDVDDVLAIEDDQFPTPTLLTHVEAYGRVDVARTGNMVIAETRGVAEFTLLLSPAAFDFSAPVKVVCDGRVVFEGIVRPSVATLMKWAAGDNDRTMLFGAELHVRPDAAP